MQPANQAKRARQEEAGARPKSKSLAALVLLLLAATRVLADDKSGKAATAVTPKPKKATRRVVVSIPDRKLALVEEGRVVKVYRVAVGAPVNPSPEGRFQVVTRIEQPTYYAPGTVIPPGKANPLGTRWIGLNKKGYGIHGTNEPRSIGRQASHGCIRMRNTDVEELFELVRAGDAVEIHGTRSVELAAIFGEPQAPAQPVPAVPGEKRVVAPVVAAAGLAPR
jgi:lipoprotein-anchoring transpeptidase ErfK/SrfK